MYENEIDNNLCNFIHELRISQGISKEQICAGICSEKLYREFEMGEEAVGKQIQNRILERLGVGAEDIFYFAGVNEYECINLKQKIIYAIVSGEVLEARKFLEDFEAKYAKNNSLERQFCLRMRSFVMMVENQDAEKILEILKECFALTAPEFDLGKLEKYILAVPEIDTLLDIMKYSKQCDTMSFLNVIEYIKNRKMDKRALAKTLPKATWYYLETKKEEMRIVQNENAYNVLDAQICKEAFDILRDRGFMPYLWELLNCLYEMQEYGTETGFKMDDLKSWIRALYYAYTSFHIEHNTKETSIFYAEHNVECVNDVILKRRKMFGLSQRKLSEGICDERTVLRIENKQSSPQREIARQLLERLGVNPEYASNGLCGCFADIQTDVEIYRKLMYEGRWNDALNVLRIIEDKNTNVNRYYCQNIEARKLFLKYKTKKIDLEKYLEQLKILLERTMSLSDYYEKEKIWLSKIESVIIQRYLNAVPKDSEERINGVERLIRYQEDIFSTEQEINKSEGLYFLIGNIRNMFDDMGNFESSNQWIERMKNVSICNRSLFYFGDVIYALWWNENEKFKIKATKNQPDSLPIEICLSLATMLENDDDISFYEKKISLLD